MSDQEFLEHQEAHLRHQLESATEALHVERQKVAALEEQVRRLTAVVNETAQTIKDGGPEFDELVATVRRG